MCPCINYINSLLALKKKRTESLSVLTFARMTDNISMTEYSTEQDDFETFHFDDVLNLTAYSVMAFGKYGYNWSFIDEKIKWFNYRLIID